MNEGSSSEALLEARELHLVDGSLIGERGWGGATAGTPLLTQPQLLVKSERERGRERGGIERRISYSVSHHSLMSMMVILLNNTACVSHKEISICSIFLLAVFSKLLHDWFKSCCSQQLTMCSIFSNITSESGAWKHTFHC
jgi:hypothetical protein